MSRPGTPQHHHRGRSRTPVDQHLPRTLSGHAQITLSGLPAGAYTVTVTGTARSWPTPPRYDRHIPTEPRTSEPLRGGRGIRTLGPGHPGQPLSRRSHSATMRALPSRPGSGQAHWLMLARCERAFDHLLPPGRDHTGYHQHEQGHTHRTSDSGLRFSSRWCARPAWLGTG